MGKTTAHYKIDENDRGSGGNLWNCELRFEGFRIPREGSALWYPTYYAAGKVFRKWSFDCNTLAVPKPIVIADFGKGKGLIFVDKLFRLDHWLDNKTKNMWRICQRTGQRDIWANSNGSKSNT